MEIYFRELKGPAKWRDRCILNTNGLCTGRPSPPPPATEMPVGTKFRTHPRLPATLRIRRETLHIRLPLPQHLVNHRHPLADRDALGAFVLALAALAALDAQGRPRIVVAAARERGRARDLAATVAELLAEVECSS